MGVRFLPQLAYSYRNSHNTRRGDRIGPKLIGAINYGMTRTRYDIIIIGGGHAGVEAAWAASRMGADVALITMQREAIGRMSCNPAIGGLGKGQIVREVDALGGLMGLAIDQAGIQFRMLNRSKGPAVWAPRAQADKTLYPKAVQELLQHAPSLDIIEGSAESILTEDMPSCSSVSSDTSAQQPKKSVQGVELVDGRRLIAPVVIVTTGTFLRGLMHCGTSQTKGGRVGEEAASGLSVSLKAMGLSLGRLKTGTPPRIHRDTINYDVCSVQPGDDVPTPFSHMTDAILQPQMNCWITWTNEDVHNRIRDNLHLAPMYSGQIESSGPRYCPSIEDKVVRFADKSKHQIFLEPEGYDDERVYCNGISTSLPGDVQQAFVRQVPGLAQAKILQLGYAVEYDFVPTHQTKVTLETKAVSGLFLAGQINGTSGYEEAAGQGLVAGVNAVQWLNQGEPFVLGRDEAYIGVMVDDLITKPPSEPYRMFTSRAEYRLLLRSDNADIRLTPIGQRLGLIDDKRWEKFKCRRDTLSHIESLCGSGGVAGIPLATWMRRPEASAAELASALYARNQQPLCTDVLDQVLIDAKYAGYVQRQAQQIQRFKKLEGFGLPADANYAAMPGLRLEARQQLTAIAPSTLGQASRITGINPADVTALWVHLTTHASRKAI